MNRSRRRLSVLPALLACLVSVSAFAASYLPMSDADLVRTCRVSVRAQVVERTVRLERDGNEDLPFTAITLQRLETFKGDIDETFRVLLPGGIVGDLAWAVPGTPEFEEGQEVVLMLNPLPGRPGEYGLSEFGLSKFDVASDERGRRFAVRPVFGAESDLKLSRREHFIVGGAEPGAPVMARDAESFLAALRGVASGGELGEVAYARPTGAIEPLRRGGKEKFANLGGVEPGNCGGQPCLFRWFWENGGSPEAAMFLTGTQTHLVSNMATCGTDQSCLAQNVVAQWHGVAGTDIRFTGPGASGNFEILLDAATPHLGTAWTTPYTCNGQGVVGIGGPTSQGGARTYRGITPYYAAATGKVSMRPWTCDYQTSVFTEVLMHESGHALGLNHPDQFESIHSTTTPTQWDEAVMHSGAHNPSKVTPQTDDIQAMQFYYGTAAPGPAPVASFNVSPSPTAGAPVSFTDTSTNSPTGWMWFFGESSSGTNTSRDKNPTHAYAGPGTYTVDLLAGNINGGSRATRQVTVGGSAAPCVPSATTLCLNNSRFRVTADWRKNSGETGHGTGVQLTSDSGYFWFFNSNNIEIVVKVLNACGLSAHAYWVFSAGLTNVEVNMNVTDTQNGTVKPYVNPLGTAYLPVQDTAAFATCP